MNFTDQEIMELKPGSRAKQFRTKYGGLYLNLSPKGTRTWRWDSRTAGGPGTITLGRWPEVDFEHAKFLRDFRAMQFKYGWSPQESHIFLSEIKAGAVLQPARNRETGETAIMISDEDSHSAIVALNGEKHPDSENWEALPHEQLVSEVEQLAAREKDLRLSIILNAMAQIYKEKFCEHD